MSAWFMSVWRFYIKREDDEAESYRQLNVKEWLTTFFRETSLQGVPQVVKQPGVMKKFYWIVAIALCAMGLEWELATFFTKFLSWTASTAVSVQTARMLSFPAVTICNNNPVTTDWYNEVGPPSKVGTGSPSVAASSPPQQATSQSGILVTANGGTTPSQPLATGGPITTRTSGVSSNAPGPLQNPPGRRKRQAPPPQQLTQGAQQSQMPPRPSFSSSLQNILSIQATACGVPYENRSIVGHQLCDMVLSMQYGGVGLDPGTNFSSWHWNSQYGNCFTFNSGYTTSTSPSKAAETWTIKNGGVSGTGIRTSSQSGDIFGLYLLLNADVAHYLSSTTQVGWRIVVHNQTEMPFPEESGILVMPGMSTRIALAMNYVERLGVVSNGLYDAPYSDCIDASTYIADDPRNAYTDLLEVSYTKSACLKTCYQRNVMGNCGCFDFNYPNRARAFSSIANADQLPPCIYDNTTLWRCKSYVAQQFQTGNLKCSCPDTCKSYTFDTTISSLKWPSSSGTSLQSVCSNLYNILAARRNGSDATCTNMSYIHAQALSNPTNLMPSITDNVQQCVDGRYDKIFASDYEMADFLVGSQFAEVYIFYKDFNYQSIVESQLLEMADLLAYLGGILGLFFGFTFLTLFEYVQFVIDLIVMLCGRLVNNCLGDNRTTAVLPLEMTSIANNTRLAQRRRSKHLQSQLRPGTVVEGSDIRLMPPARFTAHGMSHADGLYKKFVVDTGTPYVGLPKRF